MLSQTQQINLMLDHVRVQLINDMPSVGHHLLSFKEEWQAFHRRLDVYFAQLVHELDIVYGERDDFFEVVCDLVKLAFVSWQERSPSLKVQDADRENHPNWYTSNNMLGGVCYVDLYAGDLKGMIKKIPYFKELGLTYLHLMPLFQCPEGQSDGGYAVSSYRHIRADVGEMDDLIELSSAFKDANIVLVVDFIFNHTSNEHQWAKSCLAGDPEYADFYYIYPDRTVPDAYDATVREIFPDQHAGQFSQLADGRWIWTTFNSFQWDLNYSNPKVFKAMAQEMLFLANQGIDILRMDAVAFIWKKLGTDCENLPEAHALIRAFNAMARIAAPSLLFKSEAIVHPDQVVQYISPQECQLSYNPLQMALLWNSLATREVNLLQQALIRRHNLPDQTAWVNYVRCHDDIGWTFADEDALEFSIQGYDHRQFLNQFYVNRFPNSFARGVPFQEHPITLDCRISGMCASLTGVEQGDPKAVDRITLLHSVILSTGGLPLIYLGDELALTNDYEFERDVHKKDDSRWVHRVRFDEQKFAQRQDPATVTGQVFGRLRHMIKIRQQQSALAGTYLIGFETHNQHVLGYIRQGQTDGEGVLDQMLDQILVLANFSEHKQTINAITFSQFEHEAMDLIQGQSVYLKSGLQLESYQVMWLLFSGK